MTPYSGFRFPQAIIQHAVRAYLRFTLSLRAVDSEGEVLDLLVQSRCDKHAALCLMRKLLKNQGMALAELVADHAQAYGAAARELGLSAEHIPGKRKNNRVEGSHVPIRRRERKM